MAVNTVLIHDRIDKALKALSHEGVSRVEFMVAGIPAVLAGHPYNKTPIFIELFVASRFDGGHVKLLNSESRVEDQICSYILTKI